MMRWLTLVLFSLFFLELAAQPGMLRPVTWSFSQEQLNEDEWMLTFTAEIEAGWTIYSQFIDQDKIGPIPTSFHFDEGEHFELVGETRETGQPKKTGYDAYFDMELTKLYNRAVFKQRVRVSDPTPPITGYLEYMSCDKARCLPPQDLDFSFALQPAAGQAQAARAAPTPLPEEKSAEEAPTAGDFAAPAPLESTVGPEDAPDQTGPLQPVSWSFSLRDIAGELAELVFTAELEPGWTIYSQHTDPDNGPVPTFFFFEEGTHYERIGPVEEKGELKTGKDPLFNNALVKKFASGPVVFTQKIKVLDAGKPVVGYVESMACDDSRCLPPTPVDFTISLSEDPAAQAAVPTQSGLPMVDQAIPSLQASREDPAGNCGGGSENGTDRSLWLTFLLGFAGGLLALLTPCVFPMIPLTVSFFTKRSTDRRSGLRNALLYGFSIIVIYVGIGLLVSAAFGPTALNELSTNWIANVLFFAIFVLFALSFFGLFEITLPSSWANKSDAMADKGGLIGIFFMAFTLAIVSFSCTGPIIGSAIVAAAGSKTGPFVVMLGFSTALALPFGLFAAFPSLLNALPRSGSWMNSVKVVLGFVELALAFKFLSVADMTMHWNILPYELFLGIWVLIALAMGLYLLGVIRFPHDSPARKLSPLRMGLGLTTLGLAAYLLTGFLYNEKTQSYRALKLMSGLAPPTQYNLFLEDPDLKPELKQHYPSYAKCANNLDCFKDYYQGLAYAREVNKPILLDFTGYGCVNCRKTEEHIWIEDEVWRTIQEDYVLISLYVDDRKPLDEVMISKSRQAKLRNIGHKWADFQIVNFKQNSQPLYVLVSPEEQVLAPPRGYDESVEEYASFLKCGLHTFQTLNEKGGKLEGLSSR
jgi:thiol:disulfide interchange protein DsbD